MWLKSKIYRENTCLNSRTSFRKKIAGKNLVFQWTPAEYERAQIKDIFYSIGSSLPIFIHYFVFSIHFFGFHIVLWIYTGRIDQNCHHKILLAVPLMLVDIVLGWHRQGKCANVHMKKRDGLMLQGTRIYFFFRMSL